MNIRYRTVQCNGKFEIHWEYNAPVCQPFVTQAEAQALCDQWNKQLDERVALLEQIKVGQQVRVSGIKEPLTAIGYGVYPQGRSSYNSKKYPNSMVFSIPNGINGMYTDYIAIEGLADIGCWKKVEIIEEANS